MTCDTFEKLAPQKAAADVSSPGEDATVSCGALERLDDSVNAIESLFNPLLVPAESVSRIQKIASLLPLPDVDFFGFECRLGAETAVADCAFNLTPEGARMFSEGGEDLPEELRGGVWDRIRKFYGIWAETAENPHADAGSTWFEFDSSSEQVSPNMLFGYWPRRNPSRRPEWLADSIVPLLLDSSVSPAFRKTFLHCFETLPPETGDFQIGVMLSRNIQAIRLCVFDVPEERIFPWLEAIGWNGPKEQLQYFLRALKPYADFIGLHVDLGERVFPHIGVEPNFKAACWSRQPRREPRWHGQFQQLIELGVLTPEKRDALLSWIGFRSYTSGGKQGLMLRGLSHLKAVLQPGRPAIAKGYFGITHRVTGEVAAK